MDKTAPTAHHFSLDFNEKCPNVDYLVEMMRTIKQKTPSGFEKIQYVEQPTKRDLKSDRNNVMHRSSQASTCSDR